MNQFIKAGLTVLLVWLIRPETGWSQSDLVNWKRVRVLVYTKNGKGYVHDNIPSAVRCLQRLGQQHGFRVDTSARPDVFTGDNLRQYTALIFASTNNDVFDTDAQRLVFRRYIEAGGGFVGIHSVVGTERNWTWFKRLMGGTFAWHAKFQPYRLRVLAAQHPSMKDVPTVWAKSDECYFLKEMWPGPTALLASELASLNPNEAEKVKTSAGAYTDLYPAAWYHDFDGGHTWCTLLGHAKTDYDDPAFINHLFGGIRFVVSQVKTIDPARAYAPTADAPLR